MVVPIGSVRNKSIRLLGNMFSHRHAEFELSVILFRLECPSNSYILEGNSGGRIRVATDWDLSVISGCQLLKVKGATKSLTNSGSRMTFPKTISISGMMVTVMI